jgi:hypothetical protein
MSGAENLIAPAKAGNLARVKELVSSSFPVDVGDVVRVWKGGGGPTGRSLLMVAVPAVTACLECTATGTPPLPLDAQPHRAVPLP